MTRSSSLDVAVGLSRPGERTHLRNPPLKFPPSRLISLSRTYKVVVVWWWWLRCWWWYYMYVFRTRIWIPVQKYISSVTTKLSYTSKVPWPGWSLHHHHCHDHCHHQDHHNNDVQARPAHSMNSLLTVHALPPPPAPPCVPQVLLMMMMMMVMMTMMVMTTRQRCDDDDDVN